jgi:predicted ATPase
MRRSPFQASRISIIIRAHRRYAARDCSLSVDSCYSNTSISSRKPSLNTILAYRKFSPGLSRPKGASSEVSQQTFPHVTHRTVLICHPSVSLGKASSREDHGPEQVPTAMMSTAARVKMMNDDPAVSSASTTTETESPHFTSMTTTTTSPRMEETKANELVMRTLAAVSTHTGGLPVVEVEDPADAVLLQPKDVVGANSTPDNTALDKAVDTTEKYRLDEAAWRRKLREQVYERQAEQDLLQVHFQKAQRQHDTAMFLLISGAVGTGKTRLAKTLKEPVEQQGGYFLTGKFDQLCRPEPYTAFCMAFTEFTALVVERGDEAIASVSKAIHAAVGTEVSVLTSMIPSLERILGQTCDATNSQATKADNAISRFVFVFRMFVRAVCSPQQPMVILVDDLQWADPCSLDLLMSLVADTVHTRNEGLVLVGTCRDHISPSSYLSTKLREMEDQDHVVITSLSLQNFSESSVVSVLSSTLSLSQEKSVALSGIVFRQTQGNIFYVIEFIRWLHERDLLYYDHDSASWSVDDEEINLTINVCNVGHFLVDKMEQLPRDMKEVLKAAACLGSHVDEELIEYVLKKPVGNILNEAAAKGVLKYNELSGSYVFEHDGVQEAAYRLIPAQDLELFHLEIGRRLWRSFDPFELDQHIFVLLSQVNIGRRLLTREKERTAVATLCLHAGKKAAKSSTFRTASIYLNLGIELLGSRSWRDDYDLTLALHNAAAEMEMCTANFERMEQLLEEVFLHARHAECKIQAYATKIYALGVSDRSVEAIDTGVQVLKGLGEHFPSRHCKARMISEMRTVKRLLKGKSDEQLLRLPNVENKEKLAAMNILQLLYLNALIVRPSFAPFVALKSLKLTLQYGLSVFASTAFATYGMLLVGAFGEIDDAFRYGELGLVLLERFKAIEYLPRVYAAFYGCIYPWKKPIRETVEPLLRAHHVGMQTGDVVFASLCANIYCDNAIDSGTPLGVIEHEWRGFQEVMLSNRQISLLRMAMPAVQTVHHYMGLSEDPLSRKGDILDYDEVLEDALKHQRVISASYIRLSRMVVAYVFNDYDLASANAVEEKDYWQLPCTFERASSYFIGSMVALAEAREGKEVRKKLKFAKRAVKVFKVWATHSPHNFLDRLFLLQAEVASVCGKNTKAYEKYACAVAMTAHSGFLMMDALANERAARHLLAIGEVLDAEPYFRRACSSYDKWGGKAKLVRLQAEVDAIYRV